MQEISVLELLSNVDLFQNTPQDVLQELASHVQQFEYKTNELIIQKGDEGNSCFIIASGSVKIHDGEQVVATLTKGNFFGEISLLDTAPRSMSVTALESVELCAISRDDFYKVFKNQSEVTQVIVSTLTKRLRKGNDEIIRQLRDREAELSKLVNERTAQLQMKNTELEQTLAHLKATQQQLIQQEKLASLGQLTAGIAHELQNPLNFVTNFSLLSQELVDEALAATDEEEKKEIGNSIKQNLEKINHHSKRAGGIVKGMLEHTRSGKGEKAPTNINQLCDKLADLALQTMKANMSGFHCEVIKSFDETIPKANVIAQELSRVLLNLLNNSFYAVKDKKPAKVEVSTKFIPAVNSLGNGNFEIHIRDNGVGIPEDIRQKIYEPFFTTKPTGFGNTGLGLSISFDIIKAHAGTINFTSKVGEGTEFVLSFPV